MPQNSNLVGKRVRLISCNDRYTTLPAGIEGTVSLVDDLGTVHVQWDNGSRLGLCSDDGDRFEVLGRWVCYWDGDPPPDEWQPTHWMPLPKPPADWLATHRPGAGSRGEG